MPLFVAHAAGFALISAGTFQAAQADGMRSALTWLMLSVAGLIVAGTGSGVWLLQGRQAVTAAAFALLGDPREDRLSPLRAAAAGGGSPSGATELVGQPDGVVHSDRMTRYHLATCPLARGRELVRSTTDVAAAQGLAPCEVCEP